MEVKRSIETEEMEIKRAKEATHCTIQNWLKLLAK